MVSETLFKDLEAVEEAFSRAVISNSVENISSLYFRGLGVGDARGGAGASGEISASRRSRRSGP